MSNGFRIISLRMRLEITILKNITVFDLNKNYEFKRKIFAKYADIKKIMDFKRCYFKYTNLIMVLQR